MSKQKLSPISPMVKFIPTVIIPPTKKKKLFVWCDAPTVNTGFGKVAKNLLKDAHKKYEVAILGINEVGMKKYNPEKWFIYTTTSDDPFGQNRLPVVLQDFKPDVIWLFQDIFNIEKVIGTVQKYAPDVPIVTYFPVDGQPFSQLWTNSFAENMFEGQVGNRKLLFGTGNPSVKKILTYSQFAVNQIHRSIPTTLEREDIEILYHGVDTEAFKLLSEEERNHLKEAKGWKDKFVVLNVNRFQPRKQLTLSLRALCMLSYGYKKCKCGNYYNLREPSCDLNNCGPEDLIDIVLPKNDLVYYIHANRFEIVMGPQNDNSARIEAHALNAGYPPDALNKTLFLVERNIIAQPYSEEELNEFYNIADVNVSTAIGEGCGLSLLEASASGTTSIAPNNSAIPEQLRGTGRLVPNAEFFNMPYDNGHFRPVVSIPRFVDAIEEEYKLWVENGRKKVINEAAIKNIHENFLWEDKAERLLQIFDELTQDK